MQIDEPSLHCFRMLTARGSLSLFDTRMGEPPASGCKRHLEMRDADGAPRAKRRFERVSNRLERIHITPEIFPPPPQGSPSSSEDEMVVICDDEKSRTRISGSNPSILPHDGIRVVGAVVEEPEDDEEENFHVTPSSSCARIRVQNAFTRGLLHKGAFDPVLKRMSCSGQVSPGALTIWQPPAPLKNPFEDPSMKGRITELEKDEEEEDHTHSSWPTNGPHVTYPDEGSNGSSFCPRVSCEVESLSEMSGESSPESSPSSFSPDSASHSDTPLIFGRVVEVNDGTTTEEEGDDHMDMD